MLFRHMSYGSDVDAPSIVWVHFELPFVKAYKILVELKFL